MSARPFRGATLTRRLLGASVVLAVIVIAVFVTFLAAVSALRDATLREARAKDVTVATLQLENLVVDLETSVRGFALTREERFLDPWRRARMELPSSLARFERLPFASELQRRRARRLATRIRDYVDEYSIPLVQIARETPAVASRGVAVVEGKRRTDEIRRDFSLVLNAENVLAAASAASAEREARRALVLGIGGLVGSAALIVLFGLYLARSVGHPVRSVAVGATRLAGGELSLRLREGGPGEVGELTRAFNSMAERLEQSRRDLEEQNEQLRRSERQKSELVSIVSHEVRTPLASVLGFTSFLLRHDVDDETRRYYLEIIEAQGRRLSALLNDFLDVQRLEEGKLAFSQELVDITELLREQVRLFTAQSRAHRLELDVRDEPLAVHGDSNRLAQVVGNLLSNAIKYSPTGGLVEVVGEEENGSVRISVRDEGLGIPTSDQQHVFTKFFRGDAAEQGIAGSGLGLAFARAVVEAHGGELSFTSTAGKGSTFWLELPKATPAAEKAAERRS